MNISARMDRADEKVLAAARQAFDDHARAVFAADAKAGEVLLDRFEVHYQAARREFGHTDRSIASDDVYGWASLMLLRKMRRREWLAVTL